MPKVTSNDELTFTQPPAPAAEQPVEARADASAYVVIHNLVDAHPFLSIVPAADLGGQAAIERLLSLGAIAPTETAVSRLQLLGYDAAAAELARTLAS